MIVDSQSTGGISRIGGEMYAWSDRARVARTGALRHVLTGLAPAGGTVLVAGPHDDDLVAALVESASVTCLVRSVGDAERLRRLFPTVSVLCGSVAKLDTTTRYDLVLAADGVDRLGSTEGQQGAYPEVLGTLAAVVAEGGALALMCDNLLGIQHMVELNPAGHYESDAAWYPVSEYEDLRPASLDELRDRLAREGLVAGCAYAVYPSPAAPTVLISDELCGDTGSPLRGHLGAALSRAFTDAYRNTPVLSDPRRLVARALRAGAEGRVAPGWLTVARRGAAPSAGYALVASETGYTYELSLVDGRPRMGVLAAAAPEEVGVLRRVTDPRGYAVPTGRVVEERLLQLCARVDVAGLRAELGRLVTWIEDRATDGTVRGPAAFSAADSVLDDGYELRPTLPRWEPVDPVPVDVVVARALWRLSVHLTTGGHPHPWQLTSSAVDLTSTLFATVGRELTEADLRAAVDLQVAFDAADEGLTLADQHTRRLELLSVQPGTAMIDITGYRELEEALWRQRYQVSHLLAAQAWTEHIIGSRDHALSRMDWEIQLFRGSLTGKLLMLTRAVYHTVRRDGRRAVRRMRRLAAGQNTG